MEYHRPVVLSIAGYDPTGGAGVLADIKTLEQHECLGMAVITANTIQTEQECIAVEWQNIQQIQIALVPLFKMYAIDWVKIGMIENVQVLLEICHFLKAKNPKLNIIWDSILRSSSGYSFFEECCSDELLKLYELLYLITPNGNEVKLLAGVEEDMEAAKKIAGYCPVLLTGGHGIPRGNDVLFYGMKEIVFKTGVSEFYDKHGTGCILSSAISAGLANGNALEEACRKAKIYTEKVACSNRNRLAYHYGPEK